MDPFHPWIKRTSHGYHSYPSEAHTPKVSYCWPHGPNSTSATRLSMDKMFYSLQQRISRLHIDIAIAFRHCSRPQILQLHSEHQLFMRWLLHLTLLLMLLPLWSFSSATAFTCVNPFTSNPTPCNVTLQSLGLLCLQVLIACSMASLSFHSHCEEMFGQSDVLSWFVPL